MPEAERELCPHAEGIEKGRRVIWADDENPMIQRYKMKYGDEFVVDAVTLSAAGGCPIFHVSRGGICIGQFPASLFRKKE